MLDDVSKIVVVAEMIQGKYRFPIKQLELLEVVKVVKSVRN